MHDLTEICAAAFEKHVEALFAEAERRAKRALARGCTNVRAPIIGLFYDSWSDEQTERVKRLACAALVASARFERDNPTWPALPVHCNELDTLPDALSARTLLLHGFAVSLRHHEYTSRHPGFRDYGCSAMAHQHPPDEIRPDPSLRVEFPPLHLIELFERPGPRGGAIELLWRSPEMIARDEACRRFRERLEAPGADRRRVVVEYQREIALIGTG
jgi:hypothetical protein